MALKLYNSLTRSLDAFTPADPRNVTFYSCGPTVYDDAHIGNFRSFLAADILRRWIESPLCALANDPAGRGRKVLHVMNITDVGHMTDDDAADGGGEDKMAVAGRRIEEAKKAGKLPAGVALDPRDPFAVARFYADRFLDDARQLGLKLAVEAAADPSLMPRATAFVPAMIVVIERLIAGGHAYAVGNEGSRVVYFSVASFPSYGKLSGNSLEKLREGEGGRISADNQSGKRHPADFLLWKEDPRHIMKWPSPWGPGYPGWHIECTAMSVWRAAMNRTDASAQAFAALAAFTKPDALPLIDLHSGGEDNAFPHHECEIAQSCCAFNASPDQAGFARCWFHARHLFVEGAKMSKSKGNFFTARDLFARGFEPAALRLELVRSHYRSNANFTLQGLEDCAKMVERWRKVAAATEQGDANASERAAGMLADFADAMNDDLNVAKALGVVNAWINSIGSPGKADAAALAEVDDVLAILSRPRLATQASEIALYLPGVTQSAEIEGLLESRRAARAAKDFKASDVIRDQLAAMGLAIKDVAGGRVEVSRKK